MTNDQTVTQALEPCPLCQSSEVEFGGYGRGVYCIICKDCCIQTKFYPSRDAAATAWNTRTAHSGEGRDFQSEVGKWMLACFGEEIAADKIERADRFVEEALELAQTIPGFTVERARALVEYVFGRPVGERGQEVGGVGVTLAALCNTYDLNIAAEWERELARVWTKVEAIRAKQATKPVGSALPVAVSGEGRSNGAGEDIAERLKQCPRIEDARILAPGDRVAEIVVPVSLRDDILAALSAPQGEVEREGALYILDRLHRGDMPTMVAMTTVQGGRLIFTNRADVDTFVEAYRRGDNAASFTVHEVPRIDVRIFWQSCRDHDWHYANSDDMRVYREGGAVASQLAVQQTISREHRRIYQHWKKHHETGPAYGTERHPAPEEPAIAQPEAGGEL